jgi:hypothetical protein
MSDPLLESTPSREPRERILLSCSKSRDYESSLYSATGLPRFGKRYQSRKEVRDCVLRQTAVTRYRSVDFMAAQHGLLVSERIREKVTAKVSAAVSVTNRFSTRSASDFGVPVRSSASYFRRSSRQKNARGCGKPCFRAVPPHNQEPDAVGLFVYDDSIRWIIPDGD